MSSPLYPLNIYTNSTGNKTRQKKFQVKFLTMSKARSPASDQPQRSYPAEGFLLKHGREREQSKIREIPDVRRLDLPGMANYAAFDEEMDAGEFEKEIRDERG